MSVNNDCCNMNGMFVTKILEIDDDYGYNENERYWVVKDGNYTSEEISYCPLCGKKLD